MLMENTSPLPQVLDHIRDKHATATLSLLLAESYP